jgi:hypothetical protein
LAIQELDDMVWKVHTSSLFAEIVDANPREMAAVARPLNILKGLLVEVGERAAQLNDPILNDLMCRLTIYEIADPYSPDYSPETVQEIRQKAKDSKP